jgi:hypothetical protein
MSRGDLNSTLDTGYLYAMKFYADFAVTFALYIVVDSTCTHIILGNLRPWIVAGSVYNRW